MIGVSLFNLTRGNTAARDDKLWIALVNSCLGYILPNPTIKQLVSTRQYTVAPMTIFSDKKVSFFFIKLSQPIEANEQYECELA